MYTMKSLVAVGVICCFVGFLVCLAICNHICNGCLKSTFERERATEKMYTDALERLSGLDEYHPQGKKTVKLTENMLPHHVGFTPLEWMQATSCHKEEPDGAEREAARDTPKEDLQTAHKTNI